MEEVNSKLGASSLILIKSTYDTSEIQPISQWMFFSLNLAVPAPISLTKT